MKCLYLRPGTLDQGGIDYKGMMNDALRRYPLSRGDTAHLFSGELTYPSRLCALVGGQNGYKGAIVLFGAC